MLKLTHNLMKRKNTLKYFTKNILVVIGIVLVWRGVWNLLDYVDVWIFGESHFWTALGGTIIGLLILYLPDKDLKEIEKI